MPLSFFSPGLLRKLATHISSPLQHSTEFVVGIIGAFLEFFFIKNGYTHLFFLMKTENQSSNIALVTYQRTMVGCDFPVHIYYKLLFHKDLK